MIYDPREGLTWTCMVCGRRRPDARISVCKIDRSWIHRLPPWTFSVNIRFCNDSNECRRKAPEHKLGSGGLP